MAFENGVEKSNPTASGGNDVWASAAAEAWAPGQSFRKQSGAGQGNAQQAGLGRIMDCNPTLPPITHEQFKQQLGLKPGQDTNTVLSPPKQFDAEKPMGNYPDTNNPTAKPHPVLQPCEGEPLTS